jgi:hypothetical protein
VTCLLNLEPLKCGLEGWFQRFLPSGEMVFLEKYVEDFQREGQQEKNGDKSVIKRVVKCAHKIDDAANSPASEFFDFSFYASGVE